MGKTQKLSFKWKSIDLFWHCQCGPMGCQRRPCRNCKRHIHGSRRGKQMALWDQIPVSPLRYVAAGPQFTFRGQKVPVLGFLQTANTKWNSMWERLLPDLAWRPVLAGLCCNEEFKKPWPRYSMTHIKMEQVLYGFKSSSKESYAGRRAARASSSSSGSSRARSSISSSPRQVRTRAALCKQAEASAHVAHPTRQAASVGGAPRPASAAKRKASTCRSSSLSGQVSKRCSLPNSGFPKI